MGHSVAIIGTGADPETKSREGFAMAYRHAPGYQRLDNCDLVACVDINPENAAAFADRFDLEWFESHHEMLDAIDVDIVSVCVPPHVHAEIVVDCAEQGDLSAIHCEKPMATTWGDCRAMVEACSANDVQLTIDHQRRFARPVREAKRLLDRGEIGQLRRLEWSEANLFDAGSHLFDLCDHFTDGSAPTWALAGVDIDAENRWFGAINDVQGIATWGYADGTIGLASTGEDDRPTAVDPYIRLVGSDGTIEINPREGPPIRMRTDGGWSEVDTGGETVYRPAQSLINAAANKVLDSVPGAPQLSGPPSHYERAIEHVVSCLDIGTQPIIAGENVKRGTELMFACYESARQQARVDLPLRIDDNPLEAIYEERFGDEAVAEQVL